MIRRMLDHLWEFRCWYLFLCLFAFSLLMLYSGIKVLFSAWQLEEYLQFHQQALQRTL